MEVILYFFRDKITGIHYIMYAFGCYFLMFSIIGYLFKQKYLKVEVKLGTSKPQVEDSKDKEVAHSKKEKLKKEKNKTIQVVENKEPTQNAMGLVSTSGIGANNQIPSVMKQVAGSQPVVNQSQQFIQQSQVAVASQPVPMQQPQVVQQPQNIVNNSIQK